MKDKLEEYTGKVNNLEKEVKNLKLYNLERKTEYDGRFILIERSIIESDKVIKNCQRILDELISKQDKLELSIHNMGIKMSFIIGGIVMVGQVLTDKFL